MHCQEPGSVEAVAVVHRHPAPVPLWLHPRPPMQSGAAATPDHPRKDAMPTGSSANSERLRRAAKRVKTPDSDRGLVTVRMENIFTWGEFVNVDRGAEDEDDLDRAEAIARDLDQLAVSRVRRRAAATTGSSI